MAIDIGAILELGRWAPSGDNTQPWAFQVVGENEVLVHARDTRTHCVYDLQGHASQIAVGALLETLSIAASTQSCETLVTRLQESPDENPVFSVKLNQHARVRRDPLVEAIRMRTVQRRALSTEKLGHQEKLALAAAVGDYEIQWFESLSDRLRVTLLTFSNAKLRLTMREAYFVHKEIIEWKAQFSETKIPERALGVDPVTGNLMRWVLASWRRVQFFNHFLAGTWLPRLELELIPGIACGAHAVLLAGVSPRSVEDFAEVGRRLQRFWLTATNLGIQMQPEVTPLIFSRYVRDRVEFSQTPRKLFHAVKLRHRLETLVGSDALDRAVFMMRLGKGTPASARSLRLPLSGSQYSA